MQNDRSFAVSDEYLRHQGAYNLLALAAFSVGAFFRFWNLGDAPLAVDEYFFGTSILNTAERGLPKFACAGFYTRGILIQYLSLPLLWLGASLEFTTRFWPAIASLLSVIAVWRIALLADGPRTATIAVVLVSLSVWEIEFARFGRMYAPFQAVFLWYVYFQLLHLVRASNAARWSYLFLSGISIFVYAGASFLLLLNFLPLIWPSKRWSASHLIVATALLISGVSYYMNDLRHFGVPAEAAPPIADSGSSLSLPVSIPVLPDMALAIIVLGFFFVCYILLRYRTRFQATHLSFAYWVIVGLSLCFGLFGFGAGLIIAGLLLRLPSPLPEGTLSTKGMLLSIVVVTISWLGVLLALFHRGDGDLWSDLKNVMLYTISYPDVYHLVLLPWIQAIPVTTVILLILTTSHILLLLVTRANQPREDLTVQRYIAAALVLLVMLSALFVQPYKTTRYTYYLYPLVLIFASSAITHRTMTLFKSQLTRIGAISATILILFAVTEDFRIAHLLRINEPGIRYRTEYDYRRASHYYLRWDFRGAAYFVNERLNPSDSVIVFDQPLPHYLNRTSGIFVRQGTENHRLVWGCGGRQDLWSNAPLLDTEAEVRRLIAETRGNVWLIMRTGTYRSRDPMEITLPDQYGLKPEYVTQDEHLAVYRIRPPGNVGATRPEDSSPGTATTRSTQEMSTTPMAAPTCSVSV